MAIGPRVRRLFGRYERPISDAWRGAFFDLDAFAREIQARVDPPGRVLEIGCGDGAVTQRLAQIYPDSSVTGIDICLQPGRLFHGDTKRVRFLRTTVAHMSAVEPHSYGLVVVSDVIHHVPACERIMLLQHTADLMSSGGVLVLKDWTRNFSPIHLATYCADRFLTGDRVHFLSDQELRSLVIGVFGSDSIRTQFCLPPWNNNLALVVAPVGP